MAAECGISLCTRCGQLKPLNSFGIIHRRGRQEFEYHCKDCKNAAGRKHYALNKKRRIEQTSKYRKDHPEVVRKSIKKWIENHKDKHSENVKKQNKKRAGLDLSKFNELKEKQKGLCAICGLPEVDKVGRNRTKADLCIDHNHNTNKIRGLLCGKCNKALGLLKIDNLGILNLQLAIRYLEKT